MANIMILGDTWGITPDHLWPQHDPRPAQWFEFELMKRGHSVFNRSWGGNQNIHQMMRADVFLHGSQNTACFPDLVIWFQTELIRDGHPNNQIELDYIKEHGFDAYIEQRADEIYGYATQMKEKFPMVKWAIIGGHAPLLASKLHLLDWAEFRIVNWREEIAGVPIPQSHAFEFLEPWKGNLWEFGVSEDIIDREKKIAEIITAATQDREKFYNGKHPNLKPYLDLAERICKHFDL
jgi:hypothetical protein